MEIKDLLYLGLLLVFCLLLIRAFNCAMFAWSLHDPIKKGFWFWWVKKFKRKI